MPIQSKSGGRAKLVFNCRPKALKFRWKNGEFWENFAALLSSEFDWIGTAIQNEFCPPGFDWIECAIKNEFCCTFVIRIWLDLYCNLKWVLLHFYHQDLTGFVLQLKTSFAARQNLTGFALQFKMSFDHQDLTGLSVQLTTSFQGQNCGDRENFLHNLKR